ncbi:MAG TPA: hypothetical protein VFB14_29310 [Bryobacteraceae bacterium]|jgi:hypothetical protein|nr:hypothetical protein [Bryobacteraceae bacterium]
MIRKHVDLIALGALLLGLAFYCQISDVVKVEIASVKRMALPVHVHQRVIIIPSPPPPPFWRD